MLWIKTIPRPEGARYCKIHHEWEKMDITSGDESAQRATSDVHLFSRVMYFCNNESLRGGVLIIHNFTKTLENEQFLSNNDIFWEIATQYDDIYPTWDDITGMSAFKSEFHCLPGCIALLSVVYFTIHHTISVVYCKIHNSYFVMQRRRNVVDYVLLHLHTPISTWMYGNDKEKN